MANLLNERRVLLVISGGIAAYKSLDLIRRLREAGVSVRCVLTEAGAQFVTPLSLSALSQNKVYQDLWSLTDEHQMGHIRLSRETDIVVVAPATANILAKMAHGLADDLASTVLLATDKPVLVAPSMNVIMWQNAATENNVKDLRARGIIVVGPEAGLMACGEEGAGRMADPVQIMDAIAAYFSNMQRLRGQRVLVTSGPTFEPIDPVRFIGNRSSGKQGYAIAEILQKEGAETILVTGPTHLPSIPGVETIHVETADEMLAACEHHLPVDVAICAAAVSDWRPIRSFREKLKKSERLPEFQLVENIDILTRLSATGNRRPRLVIGFAAETEDLRENAAAKLRRKGCDWLIANDVSGKKGFDQDQNEVIFMRRDQDDALWPLQTKYDLARQLVDHIIRHINSK